MSNDVDTVVIGAGVVGLAVARSLALTGRDVLIVEQHGNFGTETSSRNSEVIHAGIYYPQNSLKAYACVRGKKLLYRYCEEHGIEHKKIGKLIVASKADQIEKLKEIKIQAQQNSVDDLVFLSQQELRETEPALDVVAALSSPSTGIIDSHGFMLSLLGSAQEHQAQVAYYNKVDTIEQHMHGFTVHLSEMDVDAEKAIASTMSFSTTEIINACGLHACNVARGISTMPKNLIPLPQITKGNYFRLKGKAPVSQLVYPVPEPGGLGVHITLDLAGQARFGPDVQNLNTLNYDVDDQRATLFYNTIRAYWPGLPDNALVPDYAGIRPKIVVNDELYTDFLIQGEETHTLPGLVNLFGIESPGLTSSLAIAELVLEKLK